MITTDDELPLVETALDEPVVNEGQPVFVAPALFLKYKGDKELVHTAGQAAMITLDVVTIYASGGLALATKAHWARRLWAVAEVAGAVVNIGVNTAVEVSPKFNNALTIYNGAMGAVGLYHAASGIYKVSAKLPQLLAENKNIRAIIIAKYADWQVAINAAGNLSDAERQLLTKQEKVWELLGVKGVATGDELTALISKRNQWIDDLKIKYDFNQSFNPQGLNPSNIPLVIKNEMLNGFSNSLSPSTKETILNTLIKSGNTVPVKKTLNTGEELYKIVPKGNVPGKSSFYMTKQEYDILENAADLEQKAGLPLGSHAAEYDVFKATANQTVDVFESTVAPTIQGMFKTTGGAKQTLILDIDKWTISKVKTIVPAQ